jgi:hypothetical protein
MAAPKGIGGTKLASAVSVTTTAETAALTTASVNTTLPNNTILIDFWLQITLSAASTTVTCKIYRGASTSGTLIFTCDAITVTASTKVDLHARTTDVVAGLESVQYTVSVTVASASGTSTVDQGMGVINVT